MRTDAVITIAGARDARDAASRLTMPVPDGSPPGPRSWPGGGDAMNASDFEAAGRPALTRLGAAAGHPARDHRQGRRRRPSLAALPGACRRASAIAAALGRGRRQLTPALLGVG
jgi:hypothetical protein